MGLFKRASTCHPQHHGLQGRNGLRSLHQPLFLTFSLMWRLYRHVCKTDTATWSHNQEKIKLA